MLNDTAIRKAKPGPKPRKLSDERGLFLLVTPSGSKLWRLKYRISGKEKLLALGAYPEVSLSEARERREEARKLLARDVDPGALKKSQKQATRAAAANTFEAVAREWYVKHEPGWAEGHSSKVLRRLERDVFPYLGTRPVSELAAPEILTVLRRVESRGALDTAHRVQQHVSTILRYAIATGRAERDAAADLRGALSPARKAHYATITDPKAIGDLLRSFSGYQGSFVTACALRLAPLVFVRPGELRRAEWAEFDVDWTADDLESALWRIPAEKMKSRVEHLVPLSRQALAILRELHQLTGTGRYLFPSVRTSSRPMSENTVNAALRRLGFTKDQITGHGFRSMASTILNEQGWHRDAIERQLAHGERDEVRAAYNKAEHMAERKQMMQAWADHLDALRDGAKVLPIAKRQSA